MQKGQALIEEAKLKQGFKYARRACVLDEKQCKRYYGLATKHKASTEREARADICFNAHASQCDEAGGQYMEQKPYRYPKAYELFAHGCKLNDMASCYSAGVMHQNKFLKPSSYLKERQYFKKACATWYRHACLNLAVNYIRSGKPSDIQQGIKLYRKMCKKGRHLGCVELGQRYIDGEDVKKDYTRGMNYLANACAAGTGAGCRHYADQLMLKVNQSMIQDDEQKKQVVITYLFACKYHSTLGCLRAANSAEKLKVYLDKKQIEELRQYALEVLLNNCNVHRAAYACWRVGEMYYKGWRKPKKSADAYFKKACRIDKRTCKWAKEHNALGI